MFDKIQVSHHIQKFIIERLMRHEYVRFTDLRPPKTDTNLSTYHLKLLMRNNLVKKTDLGYTLTDLGLAYVDRVSTEKFFVRSQPKIITMLLVQDGYGKVLLQHRGKQPHINTWSLPYGKIHIDDKSVIDAAMREAKEKLDYKPESLRHVGDCYIRVQSIEGIISTTLVHVCRFEADDVTMSENLQWVEPLDLSKLRLAPAVEQIVTRAFFGDNFFFEEFVSGESQNL